MTHGYVGWLNGFLISPTKTRKVLTVTLCALIFAAVFAVVSVNVNASPSPITGISFNQMNFNLDGTTYNNTDWGSVTITFTGQGVIMYFNLAVNGSWQVQNIPVLSIEGVGVTQTISFTFSLGVPSGSDVTSVSYGYSFTSTTVGSKPPETGTAAVFDQEVVVGSGLEGEAIPPLQPAKPLVGGAVANPVKFSVANFPNQDCGKNECAPAAVSNSLQYLNKKYNLGMQDNKISIAEMKKATDWDTTGAPVNMGELKKNYTEKNNYPITTRIITDISKLAEMARAGDLDGQDVEIIGGWHVAAVVGFTDLGGGKYKIDVAHDTKQGVVDGTKTEPITYDPTTKKFSGSPRFWDGSIFRYAVVECPKPPVGGFSVSLNNHALLTTYIGLYSTILGATVATAVCVKRVKRRKQKQ